MGVGNVLAVVFQYRVGFYVGVVIRPDNVAERVYGYNKLFGFQIKRIVLNRICYGIGSGRAGRSYGKLFFVAQSQFFVIGKSCIQFIGNIFAIIPNCFNGQRHGFPFQYVDGFFKAVLEHDLRRFRHAYVKSLRNGFAHIGNGNSHIACAYLSKYNPFRCRLRRYYTFFAHRRFKRKFIEIILLVSVCYPNCFSSRICQSPIIKLVCARKRKRQTRNNGQIKRFVKWNILIRCGYLYSSTAFLDGCNDISVYRYSIVRRRYRYVCGHFVAAYSNLCIDIYFFTGKKHIEFAEICFEYRIEHFKRKPRSRTVASCNYFGFPHR